jgi:hypothetical protein
MNSMKCPHCGLTNWATDENCKRCKQSLHAPAYDQPAYSNAPYGDQHQQYAPQSYEAQQQYYQPQGYGSSQGYGGGPYQYGGYQHTAGKKQGLAIASMIMSIASIPLMALLIGMLLAPVAFILGIVGVKKANRYPAEYGGKGMAIAGIVVSAFAVFVFIPIILAIAIPNIYLGIKMANEASAIRSLTTIASAQSTYKVTTGKGGCGDIAALSSSGLLPANLAKGESNGYTFTVIKVDDLNCEMHARPKTSSGGRSFMASTYDGMIHAADKKGGLATASDPRLDPNTLYPSKVSYRND